MTNAAREVLAALIAKRPGDMEPVALVVQTGLSINTVRAAVLVQFESVGREGEGGPSGR